MEGIITAWGRSFAAIVRPCRSRSRASVRCAVPGCYAYGDDHLGGDVTLRQVTDYKGQELVDRVLALVDEEKPLHVSIVGGEPLVRYRELERHPAAARRARHLHAGRHERGAADSRRSGRRIPRLQMVVSIDGLQPEHDVRRTPATYDRILKHIAGQQITVHCTVTRQQVQRDGYLEEFVAFWSANPNVRQIWFSLYTPQIGEVADEILHAGRIASASSRR